MLEADQGRGIIVIDYMGKRRSLRRRRTEKRPLLKGRYSSPERPNGHGLEKEKEFFILKAVETIVLVVLQLAKV